MKDTSYDSVLEMVLHSIVDTADVYKICNLHASFPLSTSSAVGH
jgi:hypothetical protein